MAKKYKIKNTNLYHNGHLEKIGSIIELEDEEAKKLEDVLTEVKDKTEPNNTSKTATKNAKTKNADETGTKTPDDNSEADTKTDENGGNA